jgi:hypothetical protein
MAWVEHDRMVSFWAFSIFCSLSVMRPGYISLADVGKAPDIHIISSPFHLGQLE